jgi:hypothetical protein
MNRRAASWPWSQPWPWILLIIVTLVITGLIWIPVGSCSMYTSEYQGDTSCKVGPVLGLPATMAVSVVPLVMLTRLTLGLLSARASRRIASVKNG